MAGLEQILTQLTQSDAFFASQRGLVSHETLSASKQSMVNSIVSQLENIAIVDVAGSATLNQAVQNAHWLSLENKQQIATLVTEKVAQSTTTPGQRRLAQTMVDLTCYFTEKDWKT